MTHNGPGVRVGIGYDVHKLVPGRRLVLGGVHIPSPVGLQGHSDADVLVHAVIDAVLGAAGLGDIGRLFPDTDAEYKDADSVVLLQHVARRLIDEGWRVGNVDATVVAERPRLAPHVAAMAANIAQALQISPPAVNIKATTAEGLGFVGVGHGMAAHAVALLYRNGDR